jgi:hypothetical protein
MFVLCVYMLCCPVLVEGFATSWFVVQRSPNSCLIGFRNPKRASENVDRRSTPKKVTIYTQRFKYRLHVSSLTNYDGFVQWFAAGYMRFKHGSLDAATQQLTWARLRRYRSSCAGSRWRVSHFQVHRLPDISPCYPTLSQHMIIATLIISYYFRVNIPLEFTAYLFLCN